MTRTDLPSRAAKAMRKAGWTRSEYDNTLRSRVARGVGDMKHWSDWGHLVMWASGRYDSGSAGAPRGRDLWWVPTEYVEGIARAHVAGLNVRHGCYVTTRYEDVRLAGPDVDWRIFDLQDDGRTVKVGLWPNLPEHRGNIQPLPWNELDPRTSLRLFLDWYLIDHVVKAQWFGLRRWAYRKALHAAVHQRRPFTCRVAPTPGSGGYTHWHCQLRKRHAGPHRFRNYTWTDTTSATFDPAEARS